MKKTLNEQKKNQHKVNIYFLLEFNLKLEFLIQLIQC
jgi:hypothetical protein